MANVISQSSGDFQQVDACSSQPEIFKGHPCTCGWSNRSQKPASVKVDLDQLVHFMSSEESNAEDVPTEQDPALSHESDQEQSATSKRKKH